MSLTPIKLSRQKQQKSITDFSLIQFNRASIITRGVLKQFKWVSLRKQTRSVRSEWDCILTINSIKITVFSVSNSNYRYKYQNKNKKNSQIKHLWNHFYDHLNYYFRKTNLNILSIILYNLIIIIIIKICIINIS